MIVIILGSPGSGKGTQANRVAARLGIEAISTGQLLREEVANNSELGKIVEPYMLRGDWVPAENTIEVLIKKLETIDIHKGFVLDAFPRLINELELFENYLKTKGCKINLAFNLQVDDEVSLQRIRSRRDSKSSAKKTRSDESDEVTMHRIKLHHETVKPIIDHFQKMKILYQIDGNKSVDEVFAQINNVLNDKFNL